MFGVLHEVLLLCATPVCSSCATVKLRLQSHILRTNQSYGSITSIASRIPTVDWSCCCPAVPPVVVHKGPVKRAGQRRAGQVKSALIMARSTESTVLTLSRSSSE